MRFVPAPPSVGPGGVSSVAAVYPLESSGGAAPIVTLAADAVAIGGSYVSGAPFTLPIAGASAYTPIAPAAGTPWALQADSLEFSLASAANGRLVFGGAHPLRASISGSVSLKKASGGAVEAKLGLFVNGVLLASSESLGTVGTTNGVLTTSPTMVLLQPADVIELRITNEADATDYTVARAAVLAISSVAS